MTNDRDTRGALTEREAFEQWITTVWRPDDGEALLKREFPQFAFAAFKAGLDYDVAPAAAPASDEDYKAMFEDAARDMAAIDAALGIDPEEAGGAQPILNAIKELKDDESAQQLEKDVGIIAKWRQHAEAMRNVAGDNQLRMSPETLLALLSASAQQVAGSAETRPMTTKERRDWEDGAGRWEVGFRNIVTVLGGVRETFEIKEVVEAVRVLTGAAPQGAIPAWFAAPAETRTQGAVPAGLLDALRFYANGSHFTMHDSSAWDTVSGEPQNFYEDESNTATVEDGSVAKLALQGKFFTDQEYTEPTVEGEAFLAAPVQGSDAKRAEALHSAVAAIYFEDSSDYLSALWSVVQNLAPELVHELREYPKRAFDQSMKCVEEASRAAPSREQGKEDA